MIQKGQESRCVKIYKRRPIVCGSPYTAKGRLILELVDQRSNLVVTDR